MSIEHAKMGYDPLIPTVDATRKRRAIIKRHHIGFLLLSLIIISLFTNVHLSISSKKPQKKNVIFMVTDGMGPTSLALSRGFKQYRDKSPIDDTLVLDKHLIGSSRTRSDDSLITDSAAGATAFSCALKTYNNAVGVDPNEVPCGTLLEAMKLNGYLTGLVVTTRITDATPAAFSSHASWRTYENLIAQHQIGDYPLGRTVDLMIGGGRRHFYSHHDHKYGKLGARNDTRNLIDEAINKGWSYVGNRTEFDALELGHNVKLPLLALVADNNIPFDIDRDDLVYPSLEEQAVTALNALSKASENSDNGFFLLIEGSRIDHAGHLNDPAAQVREVLAFDRTFKAVLDFVDNSDVETIVISTSDHETGGLATALQTTDEYPDYIWYPEVLLKVQHSGEHLSAKIAHYEGDDVENFIVDILENVLSLQNYTDEDVKYLVEHKTNTLYYLTNLVSFRSQTGWSTHGHSAVDVNIYAYSNQKSTMGLLYEKLGGNHENIEIGKFMEDFVGVHLSQVTKLVRDTQHKPENAEAYETLQIDEYHKIKSHYA